jgi:mercuric ion binding protein
MKSIKIIVATALIVLGSITVNAQSKAKLQTVDIKTSALCESCQNRIQKALIRTKGISKATLNIDTKVVTVKYDPSILTVDKIRTTISMSGYDADDVKADTKAYASLPDCCKKGK